MDTCTLELAKQEDELTAGMPKWAIVTISVIGGALVGGISTFLFLSVDKL